MVERPRLEFAVARAESFPDGVEAAFTNIESRLPSLRGRKFYGLAFERPGGVEYFAAVVPAEETEAAVLGLPTIVVEAGLWARSKLLGWQDDVGGIAPVVDALAGEYGRDTSRPVLEFYRSRREMEVLVPVPAHRDVRDSRPPGSRGASPEERRP